MGIILCRNPGGISKYRSSAKAAVQAAGTTGITINVPAGVQDGDLLLVFILRADDDGTTALTNASWVNFLSASSSTGNDRRLSGNGRIAASEPASYTFTNDAAASINMAGIMLAIRSPYPNPTFVAATLTDASTPGTHTSNDFTPPMPAMTVVQSGVIVVAVHGASMDNGVTGKTGGAPSGMTLVDYTESVAGAAFGAFIEVAYQENVPAGAFGTASWTGTANDATSEATCANRSFRTSDAKSGNAMPVAQMQAANW